MNIDRMKHLAGIITEAATTKKLDFSNKSLTKLPSTLPRIVNGSVDLTFNKLTSLEGSPEQVNGNFDCSNNALTSLDAMPRVISGDFICRNNKLAKKELPAGIKVQGKCIF